MLPGTGVAAARVASESRARHQPLDDRKVELDTAWVRHRHIEHLTQRQALCFGSRAVFERATARLPDEAGTRQQIDRGFPRAVRKGEPGQVQEAPGAAVVEQLLKPAVAPTVGGEPVGEGIDLLAGGGAHRTHARDRNLGKWRKCTGVDIPVGVPPLDTHRVAPAVGARGRSQCPLERVDIVDRVECHQVRCSRREGWKDLGEDPMLEALEAHLSDAGRTGGVPVDAPHPVDLADEYGGVAVPRRRNRAPAGHWASPCTGRMPHSASTASCTRTMRSIKSAGMRSSVLL